MPPCIFTGSLSFLFTSPHGYKVKLLFPLDITFEDYSKSCEEFIKLLGNHMSAVENDPIAKEVERQVVKTMVKSDPSRQQLFRATLTILVFWDRHTEKFQVVDLVESLKASPDLITRVLGDE